VFNGVKERWTAVKDWFGDMKDRVLGFFAGAGRWLVEAGKEIIGGLFSGLKSAWGGVSDWLGGLGGVIASIKGPPEKDRLLLIPAGVEIMRGLQDGLRSEMGALEGLLRGV